MRERNEALDCRIYARAAAIALGVDRWSKARWNTLRVVKRDDSEVISQQNPVGKNLHELIRS
jgi:phage terminase large subunit GpA-like protein